MNTKLFTTIAALAAVSGSVVLFTGCQGDWEPMPPGVYIQPVEKDPERVEVAKPVPAEPAPVDLTTPPVEPLPVQPPPPVVKKPVVPKTVKKTPRKVEYRKDEIRYIVKKGDNLSRIAYRYGLKIRTLKEYNNLKKNVIYPKQVLLIPPTSAVAKEAEGKKIVKKVVVKKAGKTAGKKAQVPADGIHVVKARENFTTIARKYGIRVRDMVAANPGVNSARLRIGQKLNIVAGSGKSADKVVVPAKKTKKTVAKATKKNAVKDTTPKKDTEAAAGTEATPVEDDLFSEIKSPEEASATPAAPATPAATAAPATPAAPAETTAPATPAAPAAPAETTDILSSDEVNSAKVDKIVTTPDGKLQVTTAEATTLENFAKKYQTTVEILRKDNAALPASGELKAGTVITLSNIQ